MPRIAELKGGILIFMPTDDHGIPHFHVRCNGSSYKIFIDTLETDKGRMPPKAFREVRTWARLSWLLREASGSGLLLWYAIPLGAMN